jgi:hypothetical protein
MARLSQGQFGGGWVYGVDRGNQGARLTRSEPKPEKAPKSTGEVPSGSDFLKPGFLGNMPSFRETVKEKMVAKTADISNIPDNTLIAMYQGGFYSHPSFGEMPHFDRASAVKQELRSRNVLAEFSEKEQGREDSFQSRGRAIREENRMVDEQ